MPSQTRGMSDSGDGVAAKKARLLAWHVSSMRWALTTGEDLPEWAAGIRGVDATREDCRRLDREEFDRMWFGTVPRGLIDFIKGEKRDAVLTTGVWDAAVSRLGRRIG